MREFRKAERERIENEALQNMSVIDRLRRIPGLTVSNDGNVSMRGITTTQTNASRMTVLFVINGTQMTELPDLNPQTIKKIEVLKNPDDISIYGFRGAGGVVKITTY